MTDGCPMLYSDSFKRVKVHDRDYQIKWCHTCKIYRPPRASHCRVCNNCCDRTLTEQTKGSEGGGTQATRHWQVV